MDCLEIIRTILEFVLGVNIGVSSKLSWIGVTPVNSSERSISAVISVRVEFFKKSILRMIYTTFEFSRQIDEQFSLLIDISARQIWCTANWSLARLKLLKILLSRFGILGTVSFSRNLESNFWWENSNLVILTKEILTFENNLPFTGLDLFGSKSPEIIEVRFGALWRLGVEVTTLPAERTLPFPVTWRPLPPPPCCLRSPLLDWNLEFLRCLENFRWIALISRFIWNYLWKTKQKHYENY